METNIEKKSSDFIFFTSDTSNNLNLVYVSTFVERKRKENFLEHVQHTPQGASHSLMVNSYLFF